MTNSVTRYCKHNMAQIREKLPAECHEAWDEMVNFDVKKYFTMEKLSTIAEWKGHKMQPSFPSDTTQFTYEEWTPRKGDVFISAFPKTGLNWTADIVKKLLYCNDPVGDEIMSNLPLAMGLLETGSPSKLKVFDGLPVKRRMQCTHLPGTLVNVEKIKKVDAKVIYILRNPKDQTVSWFKFLPNLPHLQIEAFKTVYSSDWKTFLENYTSGKMYLGMKENEWYPDHILSWQKHRDDKNVMFFFYEDMKKDLVKEITKMTKFLELDLSEEKVRTIAESCEFANMKKSVDEGKSGAAKVRKQFGVMRKGVVGGWKDYFTVAQSEMMDKMFEEKLGNTGIKFTYEA